MSRRPIPTSANLGCTRQGEAVEHLFRGEAQLRSVKLVLPCVDDQSIDFGYIKNNRLRGIQVKSTNADVSRTKDDSRRYQFKLIPDGRVKQGHTVLGVNTASVFVLYIIPEDMWFIIPCEEIGERKLLSLSVCDGEVKTARWQPYLDGWDLLRDVDTATAG
jgi:hypothetical protein